MLVENFPAVIQFSEKTLHQLIKHPPRKPVMTYTGFGLDTVSTAPKKSINEMTQEEQAEEGARQMVAFMMSCPGKAAISGVTGFGLGGIFGLFMASVCCTRPPLAVLY